MNLQIVSDIHAEYLDSDGANLFSIGLGPGADVLVMAGDIVNLHRGEHLRDLIRLLGDRYKHIVYVPGNHEFWGFNPFHAWNRLKKMEREFPHFHALNNEKIELDGQEFYGGTMWFGEPDPSLDATKRRWPDYKYISSFEPWVYASNQAFKDGFGQVTNNSIVVTHHLPSMKSVAPRYAGDPSNHWYVTEMDQQIAVQKPKLWIHGHTHTRFDYRLEDTRVVCNPYGYSHENTYFDPALTIDLP